MNWSKTANKNLKKLEARNLKIHRAAMSRLAIQTDIRSPVDEGVFRANWFGAYGQIDRQTTESASRDSVGSVNQLLGGDIHGNYFYYTNSLPYAWRLEYEAWSLQAPNGMVRLTARQFPRFVREAARTIK